MNDELDLNAIRERAEAATEGPWWYDEDDQCWRLHGVAGRIPPQMDGAIPEQIVNEQILKAPKTGTPYAEYWPKPADAELIVHAREDIPALLAEVERLREEVTFHNTVRLDVEKVLDKAHGTEEADGAGAGLAADVDLLRVQRDDARGIAVALKHQLARVRDDCQAQTAVKREGDGDYRVWLTGVWAQARRILNILDDEGAGT